MRVHFINTPTVLGHQPREIVFGLQASPTKPMPANWRTRKNHQVPMHGGSNGYGGIIEIFAGKFPVNMDWSIIEKFLEVREAAYADPNFVLDESFIDRVAEQHFVGFEEQFWRCRYNHFMAGYRGNADVGRRSRERGYRIPVMIYFEEHCMGVTTLDFRTFQDEWYVNASGRAASALHPERVWDWDTAMFGVGISAVRSYQDMATWYGREWIRRSNYGLYTDNAFPNIVTNPYESSVYLRPDGTIQPSTDIWALREYHQRMWIMAQQEKVNSRWPIYISLHMTNGNIIPVLTWSDISLDNEWSWGDGRDHGYVPFPSEVLLAEMTGLHVGNYPHALYEIVAVAEQRHLDVNSERYNEIYRTEWGWRFIHEIIRIHRVWEQLTQPEAMWAQFVGPRLEAFVDNLGYGQPDVRIINYWMDDDECREAGVPLIHPDDPSFRFLGMYFPDGRLIVVAVNEVRDPMRAMEAKRRESDLTKSFRVRATLPDGRVSSNWVSIEEDTAAPVDGVITLPPWGVGFYQLVP
jgi:hypothetical protein